MNKAHDAAINNGAAITIKRVSIIDSPFLIFEWNTENNINIQLYYCNSILYMKFEIFLRNSYRQETYHWVGIKIQIPLDVNVW